MHHFQSVLVSDRFYSGPFLYGPFGLLSFGVFELELEALLIYLKKFRKFTEDLIRHLEIKFNILFPKIISDQILIYSIFTVNPLWSMLNFLTKRSRWVLYTRSMFIQTKPIWKHKHKT